MTVPTLAVHDLELGDAFVLLGPRGRVGQAQDLARGFVQILGKAQIRGLIICGGFCRCRLLVLQVQRREIIHVELLLVFVGRKRAVVRFPVHVPAGVLGCLLVVKMVFSVSVEAVQVRRGVEVGQEAGHVGVGERPFLQELLLALLDVLLQDVGVSKRAKVVLGETAAVRIRSTELVVLKNVTDALSLLRWLASETLDVLNHRGPADRHVVRTLAVVGLGQTRTQVIPGHQFLFADQRGWRAIGVAAGEAGPTHLRQKLLLGQWGHDAGVAP